jgi:hypothetical protein
MRVILETLRAGCAENSEATNNPLDFGQLRHKPRRRLLHRPLPEPMPPFMTRLIRGRINANNEWVEE